MDQFYFESGYIDDSYFVYIADAGSALSCSTSLTCAVGKIVDSAVNWSGVFTSSMTINATRHGDIDIYVNTNWSVTPEINRSTEITLDNIANISSQADKLHSTATSTMAATFAFSAEVLNVIEFSSTFPAVQATVTTNKYFGDFVYSFGRPRNFTGGFFDSSRKKFGTHSLSGGFQQTFSSLSPSWSRDYLVEFWFYWSTEFTTSYTGFNINLGFITFTAAAAAPRNRLTSSLINSGGGAFGVTTSAEVSLNQWHHVAVVKNGNRVSRYIDGVRFHSVDYGTQSTNSSSLLTVNQGGNKDDGNRIDELSIWIGDTLGYDATSTTITVPTAARVNDRQYTQALWHFDGDGVDDTVVIESFQSTQTAEFTASAEPTITKGIAKTFVSEFDIDIIADSVKSAEADLSTTFSQTADSSKFVDVTSTQNVVSTLTVQIGSIKTADSQLSVSCALSADALDLERTDVTLSCASSLTALIGVIKRTSSNQAMSSTLVSNVNARRRAVSLQSTTATATVIAAKQVRGLSTLTITATVAANGIRPVEYSSSLTATFTCVPYISRYFGTGRPRPLFSNGGELADISAVGVNSVRVADSTQDRDEYIRIPGNPDLGNFGVVEFWFGFNLDTENYDMWQLGPNDSLTSGPNTQLLTYGNLFEITLFRTNERTDTGGGINYRLILDTWIDTTLTQLPSAGTSFLQVFAPYPSSSQVYWFRTRITKTPTNFELKLYNQSGTEVASYTKSHSVSQPTWSGDITFYGREVYRQVWNGSTYVNTYWRTKPMWYDEILITNQNGITNVISSQPYVFSDQSDVLALYHLDGVAPYEWPGGIGTFDNQDDTGVIAQGNISLSSQATVTAAITIAYQLAGNLSSTTALAASITIRKTTAASVSAQSTLSITATRRRSLTSTQSAEFNISSTASKTVGLTVNANAEADLDSEVTRIRAFGAQLPVIGSQLTAAFRNATGTILLELTTTWSSQANKITDVTADFDIEATQSADILKIVSAEAELNAEFNLSTIGRPTRPASASLTANSTLTSTAEKVQGFVAEFNCNSALSVTATRAREFTADFVTDSNFSTPIELFKGTFVDLTVSTDFFFNPQFIIRITAEFTAFNSLLVVSDTLNIDPALTLRIKAENRGLIILPESRIITIKPESRILEIYQG